MVVQMRLCEILCRPEAKSRESKELDRVIGAVLGTFQALTPRFGALSKGDFQAATHWLLAQTKEVRAKEQLNLTQMLFFLRCSVLTPVRPTGGIVF